MVTITEPHPQRASRHTLHQGGSQRLFSFLALLEHVAGWFFFRSSFPLPCVTFSPSLSPLSTLRFRSSSIADGGNPGDAHTHCTQLVAMLWQSAVWHTVVYRSRRCMQLHSSRDPLHSSHTSTAGLGWRLWRCLFCCCKGSLYGVIGSFCVKESPIVTY